MSNQFISVIELFSFQANKVHIDVCLVNNKLNLSQI